MFVKRFVSDSVSSGPGVVDFRNGPLPGLYICCCGFPRLVFLLLPYELSAHGNKKTIQNAAFFVYKQHECYTINFEVIILRFATNNALYGKLT